MEDNIIKAIHDKIIRDSNDPFVQEDYYKPVRIGNLYNNNNYIDYKRNGDKNKALSIKEYFDEIMSYLKDIIKSLKKSDKWKI